MPQMIADLFEGQAIGDQSRRAGVTQGMRPTVSGLDFEGGKPATDNTIDAAGYYSDTRVRASAKIFPDGRIAGEPYQYTVPEPRQRMGRADTPGPVAASNGISHGHARTNRSDRDAMMRLHRGAVRRSRVDIRIARSRISRGLPVAVSTRSRLTSDHWGAYGSNSC